MAKGEPMGEHGASFSGESIYDDTDEGSGVVRIASVAALSVWAPPRKVLVLEDSVNETFRRG